MLNPLTPEWAPGREGIALAAHKRLGEIIYGRISVDDEGAEKRRLREVIALCRPEGYIAPGEKLLRAIFG